MTVPELFARAAAERPDQVHHDGVAGLRTLTELAAESARARHWLRARGIGPGSRVATIAGNDSPGLIACVFAIVALRATWVPVNTRLTGDSLEHQVNDADPHLVLLGTQAPPPDRLPAGVETASCGEAVTSTGASGEVATDAADGAGSADPSDVSMLIYTSGTSGNPKAVQVTDLMWRTAAAGAIETAGCGAGDRLFVWEPWCHIGGAQVLLVPLLTSTSLAVVERFSASRFFDQARAAGATHMHHLGGIAQILLQRPASPDDRDHPLRVSWGGGMDADTWRRFSDRFGITVRECYGQTENASICTVNPEGPHAGVGRPLPSFDVRIADADGTWLGTGHTGRVLVGDHGRGLVTPGYRNNESATAAATVITRDGTFWDTGDLGAFDADGYLHLRGRASDSVRRRGENVSCAWVERALSSHAEVAEVAVIGVDSDLAEQDILAVVVPASSVAPDERRAFAARLTAHVRGRLADFEVPRWWRFVDELPKTPSLRVVKRDLPRTTDDAIEVG